MNYSWTLYKLCMNSVCQTGSGKLITLTYSIEDIFFPTVRVSPRKEKRYKRATSLGSQQGHDFTIYSVPSESFYCVPKYGASTVHYCTIVVVELVGLLWKSKMDRGFFFPLLACLIYHMDGRWQWILSNYCPCVNCFWCRSFTRSRCGVERCWLSWTFEDGEGSYNKHRDRVAWKTKLDGFSGK